MQNAKSRFAESPTKIKPDGFNSLRLILIEYKNCSIA
jgi:hypothetical protein